MKTQLTTAHEETFTKGTNSKSIGILLNFSVDDNNPDWKESFVYVFHGKTYIFFNTMIEMFEYLLYGDKKMKRAYMEEEVFDEYYDAEYLDGEFGNALTWLN
jgi:hypothetical protein